MIDIQTQRKSNEYVCNKCSFYSVNKHDYTRHLSTNKHLTLTDVDGTLTKKHTFDCICGKEYKYRQSLHAHKTSCSHLSMRKQCKSVNIDATLTRNNTFDCVCGKEYKFRQSLHVHKKTCSQLHQDNLCDETPTEPDPQNEMVAVLLEQNTMFQELILKNEEQRRKSEEEKNELLRRNQEQQSQMMDLHKQFLEAIKKSLQQ